MLSIEPRSSAPHEAKLRMAKARKPTEADNCFLENDTAKCFHKGIDDDSPPALGRDFDDDGGENDDQPGNLTMMAPTRTGGGMARTKSLFSLNSNASSTSSESTNDDSVVVENNSWFGRDVHRHTGGSDQVPVFDKHMRAVMEPHLTAARLRREKSRNQTLLEVDASIASSVGVPYTSLRGERPFLFDEHTHPLHTALADTLGVKDLSRIHELYPESLYGLLEPLLHRAGRLHFQKCYDSFVTHFCIPLLHFLAISKNVFHSRSPTATNRIVYRYQAFPEIVILRPGDVSPGPDCDTSKGHSIGTLKFYIPLTAAFGTNALYTESHPGREDWHPLVAKSVGLGYLFDGARCLHFRLENTTQATQVALEFRVAIHREGETEVHVDGLCTEEILEDKFYLQGPGYYDEATIDIDPLNRSLQIVAKKNGNQVLDPDKRVGFPF